LSGETIAPTETLASAKVRVPQHVVYRSFPTETVVLNLNTGKYHGLNVTAGAMLQALERASSLREAAVSVAVAYGQAQATVERDMGELCRLLLDRGLIEVERGVGS
jgi:Coenzyme PQQ synthesis protein D (PqqD)